MENPSLTALGWSEFFEAQLKDRMIPRSYVARVVTENKTNYRLRTESREVIAEVTGKLMFTAQSEAELPKVGDWVIAVPMDEDRAIIHEVLPRKTVLSRKSAGRNTSEQVIATNLDVVFIVQGLDDNFNIARLERYLVAVRGMMPVIVLNKADLCADPDEKIQRVKQRIPGVDVVTTSSLHNDIGNLRDRIKRGQTFAFTGSSGVGKSSLINALLAGERLKTAAVRAQDSRGRHTTSRREMIFMDDGGILIDTPGMREFEPWSEQQDVSMAFGDIERLAGRCRFADCHHTHETGCAVKEAVESGLISSAHYANYLKLVREMDYQQSLTDASKALARKKLAKRQIKAYNKIVRNKRRSAPD